MININPLDRLFVTVRQNGVTRMITELSGVTSFADIVSAMRSSMPGLLGLATVMVRNSTEGWTSSRSVFLR